MSKRLSLEFLQTYAPFIEYWRVEIFDSDTNRVVKEFEGERFNIYDSIFWKGKDSKNRHILTDRHYAYRVYVQDKHGAFDETKPQAITFKVLDSEEKLEAYHKRWTIAQEKAEEQAAEEEEKKSFVPEMNLFKDDKDKEEAKGEEAKEEVSEEEKAKSRQELYQKWIRAEHTNNNLKLQTIHVDGETILINRQSEQVSNVRIIQAGQVLTDIFIPEEKEITARELLEGEAKTAQDKLSVLDVILPKGKYEIVIQKNGSATRPVDVSTEADSVLSIASDVQPPALFSEEEQEVYRYIKPVQVGDDFMFFVGLGDAKMGYGFVDGRVEPIAA